MGFLYFTLCTSLLVMSVIGDSVTTEKPADYPSKLEIIKRAWSLIDIEPTYPGSTEDIEYKYPQVKETVKKVHAYRDDPETRVKYCEYLIQEEKTNSQKPADYSGKLELARIACSVVFMEGVLKVNIFTSISAKRSNYCKTLIDKTN